jgi:hypothetical protein
MGKSAVWCGSASQRFLIGFSLSQVDIGKKTKAQGGGISYIPTNFCSRSRLIASTGGNGQGAIWGLIHPEMVRPDPKMPFPKSQPFQ